MFETDDFGRHGDNPEDEEGEDGDGDWEEENELALDSASELGGSAIGDIGASVGNIFIKKKKKKRTENTMFAQNQVYFFLVLDSFYVTRQTVFIRSEEQYVIVVLVFDLRERKRERK